MRVHVEQRILHPRKAQTMMYYVATLVRYVLVEAKDEGAARVAGYAALVAHHADLGERLGREVPIEIMTVRPATTDEIEICRWNEETLAREAEWQANKVGENR